MKKVKLVIGFFKGAAMMMNRKLKPAFVLLLFPSWKMNTYWREFMCDKNDGVSGKLSRIFS